MADIFDKKRRSKIMSAVKSTHNKSTELKLIRFFREHRISGWRRNYKLFGRPDFVFPKLRLVIFTDGCFWHGHNCRNTTPKDNKTYWAKKIKRNRQRDKQVSNFLKQHGWTVMRLWECQLQDSKFRQTSLYLFHLSLRQTNKNNSQRTDTESRRKKEGQHLTGLSNGG